VTETSSLVVPPQTQSTKTSCIVHNHQATSTIAAKATETAIAPPQVSLTEATKRVLVAKEQLFRYQRQSTHIDKNQEKAEAEFTRRKSEFVELYANKTERLNIAEKECFEASNSTIVVTVKGVVRHNIQFGKIVCATYSEKRTALAKEHDEELRKLVKECMLRICSHSLRDVRIAKIILDRERELLQLLETGASTAKVEAHERRTAHLKRLWSQPEYATIARIGAEYSKYCKFKHLDINWAHDVLRPKEALAAVETCEKTSTE